MATASDDIGSISVELARLRGEMTTGFAKIGGQLDVITASQDQARRDLDDLETRVTALEARRWPMGSVAVASGVVSAAVAVVGYFVGQ